MAKTNFLKCPDAKTFVGYARKLVVNKVVPVPSVGQMTVKQFYDLSPQKVKDNIERWIGEGVITMEFQFEIKKLEKKPREPKPKEENKEENK